MRARSNSTAVATLRGRSPSRFFLLVFALSIPFALLGTTGLQLMPGSPVSALGFVCPVNAAAILVSGGPRTLAGGGQQIQGVPDWTPN